MAARVFSAMSRAICSVILITQSSSEYSISFCIPSQELSKACVALDEEFNLELKNGFLEPISVIRDLAIISVVGDGMRTNLGISSRLFGALTTVNINIIAIAQGSSERSVSVVVNNDVTTIGMQAIHRVLFNKILMIKEGLFLKLGDPFIQNWTITAIILAHGLAKKVKIVKFRRRKHFRKCQGHRQNFTKLKILSINNI